MPSPSRLDREEYIEQEYFFRVYRERLDENLPSQEILQIVHEEILATTRLPLAIDFLRGEILLTGRISDGMKHLSHYFTPFQSFVMTRAEDDRSRFDQRTALAILEREAKYRAESPPPAGLFIFQFECLARNRLGYEQGMQAMAGDPFYEEVWQNWINRTRLHLGSVDFADLVFYRSEYYRQERIKRDAQRAEQDPPPLFGVAEGRIARANRGRDPLYMFAALQRQLDYPSVPRPPRQSDKPIIHPVLEYRLHQLETRLKIIELESKNEFDLSKFYVPGPKPPED